ncbi:MAG: serine/threonine protein kinase with PASTA sensor(s) [Ignavibacteria bacterium]|nr:MAG: serine/threonine protein kinase with PASTA sensor(s) [Ignavibacteria bacterium]KAF0160621.1 MAG: serine/threonine protein kinase with PASTA sensor(s) [Ignavibacteria bacterium]
MENLIGKVIDNFRVVSVLGKGGMGIVYKAYDTRLDRYVAIKLLSSSVIDKDRFVERFKREAKNQAKLTHPNIVAVYGFIEYSNLLGIVMEYVEGESLEKVIDIQGRFNLQDVVYILKHLLQGIGYAHQKGFIHRDIKPSNIILNKEGITKIMDFGISKSLFDNNMTQTGSKIGTVYYMSPEQIRGHDVTNKSDIYSIGCAIYEMIVGQPPFDFTSEYEVMDGHLKKTVPKISERVTGIPEKLEKILTKALQKDPNARYSNCEEMYNEVLAIDKQLSKIQTSYFEKIPPRSKKYKFFAVSTFAGSGVFLLVLMYFVINQVSAILESNELEKFKKYSIQTLFESENKKMKLSEITRVPSGVIANLNSISFASDVNYAVIVGDSSSVLTSKDGGDTWLKKLTSRKLNLSDVHLLRNGNAVLVGDSSAIYLGINNLDSLIQISQPQGTTFFRVKFFNQTGYITGNKGVILKSLDGGYSWTRTKTNTNEILFDISFFNDKKGFAVGWNGTILATTNGGDSWYKVKIEDAAIENNYLKSIDLNYKGYGLIVGGDGTILRTTNFGNSWEKLDIKFSGGFQKVKFINEDFSLIIGSKGVILVSKDKGETWNVVDSRIYSNLNGISVSAYGKIFLVGINGMIYRIQ